jgi:hypothetical protein
VQLKQEITDLELWREEQLKQEMNTNTNSQTAQEQERTRSVESYRQEISLRDGDLGQVGWCSETPVGVRPEARR